MSGPVVKAAYHIRPPRQPPTAKVPLLGDTAIPFGNKPPSTILCSTSSSEYWYTAPLRSDTFGPSPVPHDRKAPSSRSPVIGSKFTRAMLQRHSPLPAAPSRTAAEPVRSWLRSGRASSRCCKTRSSGGCGSPTRPEHPQHSHPGQPRLQGLLGSLRGIVWSALVGRVSPGVASGGAPCENAGSCLPVSLVGRVR